MSTTTREIIVGNNDSSIEYSSLSSSWVSVESTAGSLDAPILYPKLHGLHSNESLQFKFNGTQISLSGGTQDIENMSRANWTCFVDYIPYIQSTDNNWEFCNAQGLADTTTHVLTLNATREGQPFWVDYISYTPSDSESVSLDDSLIRVSNVDPDINFSPGWVPGDEYNMTSTNGSSMSFDFFGQSLLWYGDINYMNPAPIASYVVDDKPLPTPTPGSVPSQNQPFFEVHSLDPGLHSFRVTFNGDQSSTPLTLAFMLVQNGNLDPISSPTPTSTPTSTSTSTPSTTASNSNTKVNIGAIVGGSLAAIILLLLVFLFFRYRKQTRKTRSMTIRPSFSESVTDKAVPQPVHYDTQLYKPVNAYHDETDEKSPYYGGYQTWGQIKAIEAGSKSNIRDSYM